MAFTRCDRFMCSTTSEFQAANRSGIYDYQHLPILPLEEAVQTIISKVPGLLDYVAQAKENCNRNSTLLTPDESAAIYIYSMPIPFYSLLNEALRAADRNALKPWLSFMKLFMNALEKLPSLEVTVWRGVPGAVGAGSVENELYIWWGVTSCSLAINVVEPYVDQMGTIFKIDAIQGKDISRYSMFKEEKEVILMPGTRVRVKSRSLILKNRLFIVDTKEEADESVIRRVQKEEQDRKKASEKALIAEASVIREERRKAEQRLEEVREEHRRKELRRKYEETKMRMRNEGMGQSFTENMPVADFWKNKVSGNHITATNNNMKINFKDPRDYRRPPFYPHRSDKACIDVPPYRPSKKLTYKGESTESWNPPKSNGIYWDRTQVHIISGSKKT